MAGPWNGSTTVPAATTVASRKVAAASLLASRARLETALRGRDNRAGLGSTVYRHALLGTRRSSLFACAVRPAGAQVAVGRLAGTVEDQTGGVVPGVHVLVLNAAGHAWATS